jgi:ribosomal protein S18 acetylase RimI-like enzyme
VFAEGTGRISINYRNAIHQDEELLFALAARLSRSFKLNKSDFSKTFQEILSNKNADVFIAENESGIVGYVLGFHHSTFYANGVVSWVDEIFVLDEYRGMKIEKQLMMLFEEMSFKRGSKLVALATRRASAFYKAIGYEESLPVFFIPGHNGR